MTAILIIIGLLCFGLILKCIRKLLNHKCDAWTRHRDDRYDLPGPNLKDCTRNYTS